MKLKNRNKELLRKSGFFLLPFLVDLLLLTVKIKTLGKTPETGSGNFVSAFWHGKMLIGWRLFKKLNPAAIVSSSKDGELLTRVLEHWGYHLVRGSSSKGGKEALENLVEKAREGFTVVITPDGPRGPAREFKAGAVVAAKKSGVPLLLAGIGFSKSVKLKSWDSFEIPYPFSHVYVKYSEPVLIGQDLSYEETSGKITEAEKMLNELTNEAEELAVNS